MNRYHNLTEMLAINRTAHAYFDTLPDRARRQIIAHGDCLHSDTELRNYANLLLRQQG